MSPINESKENIPKIIILHTESKNNNLILIMGSITLFNMISVNTMLYFGFKKIIHLLAEK